MINFAALDKELVRRFGFKEFVKLAFPHVIQNEYVHSDHIDVICQYCEDIYNGKPKRAVINVPPASGKSTIISVLFPVWCWIQNPKMKICTVSYSPEISAQFSNKSLELINSDWFQERWPIKIKGLKVAKGDYENSSGGRRLATSIGSKLTGLHFDIIFVDDPLKAGDKLARHGEVVEFFKETLPTRLIDQSEGKIVLIMQRLKPYDVSNYLLESNWDSLILPMEFDPAKADPRDTRKAKGEILNPRITPEALERLKIALGDYAYAQLQQDPIDSNEAIFKPEYFQWILPKDIPEKFDSVVLSLDAATYGKATSDYSSLVLIGKNRKTKELPERYYLIDAWRYKMDFAELKEKVKLLFGNELRKYKNVEFIIENKALGPSLVSQLNKEIGSSVKEYKVGTRSKEERAHGVTHLFRSGSVFISDILKGDFRKELSEFPNSKNDDYVDACTQGLEYLSDTPTNFWSQLTSP